MLRVGFDCGILVCWLLKLYLVLRCWCTKGISIICDPGFSVGMSGMQMHTSSLPIADSGAPPPYSFSELRK